MVVVDTSVWSGFLRRKRQHLSSEIEELKFLIMEGQAVMLGVVKQELLSGMHQPSRFAQLRDAISGFESQLASEADHVLAAEFFTRCRGKGIQGSFVDFLICAQATRLRAPILTLDKDFCYYAKHLPIRLR